jgi:hypothetical protein
MAIDLPNMSASTSTRIVACGAVYTEEKSVREWLKERRHMIAAYKKGGKRHFVRLMTGGRKDRHFHLEVALANWFPGDAQPTVTSKLSEVQEAAAEILGAKLDLHLSCDFTIEFKKLPDGGPIRLLSAETRVAGTAVQLTAGVLTVSGSRINEIAWSRYSEDMVMITLEAHLDLNVAPKYLLEGQEMMERFFRVLVLGQPTPTGA